LGQLFLHPSSSSHSKKELVSSLVNDPDWWHRQEQLRQHSTSLYQAPAHSCFGIFSLYGEVGPLTFTYDDEEDDTVQSHAGEQHFFSSRLMLDVVHCETSFFAVKWLLIEG
jgi:hypothetical protein